MSQRFTLAVAVAACFALAPVDARALTPAELLVQRADTTDSQIGLEFSKLDRPSDTIGAIGAGLFGESVDLYGGDTQFKVTDIDLPGNGTLPVRLARTLSIGEGDWFPFIGGLGGIAGSDGISLEGVRGWNLDVPYMSGTFAVDNDGQAPDVDGWRVGITAASINRCSVTGGKLSAAQPPLIQSGAVVFRPEEYWSGYNVYVPGAGSQDLLWQPVASAVPSSGGTYYWATKNFWSFRCTTLINGGAGEGFIARSPDGTEYKFNQMVARGGFGRLSAISKVTTTSDSPPVPIVTRLFRQKVYLLATEVKDRFGHTVNYNYSTTGRLNSITSSDGRQITLSYTGSRITSATDGSRTWNYAYSSGGQLQTVTLPDSSSWTYADPPAIDLDVPRKNPVQTCQEPITDYKSIGQNFVWSATHPSGAAATFNFQSIARGRSYVLYNCAVDTNSTPTDEAHLFYPVDTAHVALKSKVLSGAGLDTTYTWTYDYSQTLGCFESSPIQQCTEFSPVTVWTDVISPDLSKVRRTFGNRYEQTEGQLQTEAFYTAPSAGSILLHSNTTSYVTSTTGQPFPNRVGSNPQFRANVFLTEALRPQLAHTQQRQGVTFSATTQGFDAFTHPTSVVESSYGSGVPTYTRTRTLEWLNVVDGNWVLGLLDRSLVDNIEVVDNFYTPQPQFLLGSVEHYGRPHQSYTFYPNGTANSQAGELATVTDGRGKVTSLSSYYRGTPQLITHPAGGGTRGAVVDPLGRITSLTDEAGYTTGYTYDSMGRLNKIVYPPRIEGGSWDFTTITASKQTSSEFGIAGTRWRQTVSTGNRQKVVDFDVLLRPILSREFDAANPVATLRAQVNRYDADGQVTFASYPQRTVGTANDPTIQNPNIPGIKSSYDALGRKTLDQQTSELVTGGNPQGLLNTTYQYLNGFKTQVTNPRNFSTVTEYQVYADPGEANAVKIDSPEFVTTLISRDVFGKPSSITRNATYAGLPITLTRRYVYDGYQRLCKTIEPESGAKVQDYDGASNVIWTAAGQNLLGTTTCDQLSVPASAKISQSYDDLSRPLDTTFGDASPSINRTWTADGLPNTISSSISTWTYTYNDRRLLTKEALSLAGITLSGPLATPLEVNYQYNALGNLSSWDYPGSGALALSPNALGEPSQTGAYASGISWHPNGMLAGMSYGNGVIRSVILNARQLPQNVAESGVSADAYTYDAAGNILGIADTYTGDAFKTGRTFGYDGRDRLTNITYDQVFGGSNYNNVAVSYDYDGLDNIRRYRTPGNMPFRQMDYQYNASTWRLTRVYNPGDGNDFVNYQYDARGNAIVRGGGWGTQTFDLGNRMRGMAGSGVAANYDYDGEGRRFMIDEPGANRRLQIYNKAGLLLTEIGLNATNGVTELKNYFYNGRNVIAERRRISGSDITSYVHSDHLGSPTARSNSVASVTERTLFEVYGLKLNSQPNPPYGIGLFPDGIGFAGHRTDRVSGLSYMQQRYYDPVSGRFISMDPVTADEGPLFNRYAYANNNPIGNIDPDGRAAFSGGPFFDWLATPADMRASNGDMVVNQFAHELSRPTTTMEKVEMVAVAMSLGVGGGAGGLRAVGAVERAGAAAGIPDAAFVVRGGSATVTEVSAGANSVAGLAKGIGDHPEGVRGFSADSAAGASVCDLCRNVRHNQVGVTTAGEIRKLGGDVIKTGGQSPNHVTVTNLGAADANRLLTPTVDNPVPRSERPQ